MSISRDARLGPLRFPTLEGDVKEALGDTLEQVGAVALPGERRARPFPISFPIHGISTDGNQYLAVGQRLRRQVRALVENPKARAEFLWFEFAVDSDLNAWVLAGGGDLSYTEQGTTFADYLLELTDCYKAGDRNTHRPARRLTVRDRRLSTEPRDTLGLLRSTDFAGLANLARHWLPVNASDLLGARGTGLPQGIAVPTKDGSLQLVIGRANSDVLSYDLASVNEGLGDVLVRDRKGTLGYGFTLTQRGLPAPTAYWRLSENTGTTSTDQSGNGRTLTIVGTVTKDQPGATLDGSGSWLFDGATGRADSTYNPYTGSLTVGGWALRRTNATNDALFGSSGVSVRLFGAAGSNDATFTPDNTNVPSQTWAAALPAPGAWFHWALTWNATTRVAELFVNGVSQGTKTYAGGFNVAPGNLQIAARGGAADPFDGYLEDVAVWAGSILTAAQVTTLYQAGLQTADPEVAFGWENLYGPSQQVTAGDVPILENGRCRVRYDGTNTPGFRVDVWDGAKWAEQGKVLVERRDTTAGLIGNLDTLVSAAVVEWTPERAVLKVVMRAAAQAKSREQVFVTLQRGWSGPRFEVYLSPQVNGQNAGASILTTLVGAPTNDSAIKIDSGSAAAIMATAASGSTVFPGANVGASTFTGENEVAVIRQGGTYTLIATVLQAAAGVVGTARVDAYGINRSVLQVYLEGGASSPGYLSTQLGFHAQATDQMLEAEVMSRNGTSTIVADAAGSGGQVVEDTQVAQTSSVQRANSNLGAGKYRFFGRVRVVNAGATGSFRVNGFAGIDSGPIVTTTSTAYVWLDLGEMTLSQANRTFWIAGWRSAGTGAVRIDRVEAVKVEDRVATVPAYDGARDLGQAALAGCRQSQRLLARAA